jgi:hypothetical protein
MSIPLMTRVYELDLDCIYERFVLVRLADRTNETSGVCWPSVATIARDLCCSPRKVQGVIKDLESRELLRVERNAGPKGCNLYHLTLPTARDAPPHIVHPSKLDSAPPHVTTQTTAQDAPEPKKNQKKTRRNKAMTQEDQRVVDAIKECKHYLVTQVSAHKARTLVSEGRVTEKQCKDAGLL